MKKLALAGLALVVLIVLVALVALPSMGLSVTQLMTNVTVGTGMGAKLACSARYLSGFAPERVASDLASYSPATELLAISYDDTARLAHASLLGMAPTTARYRDGLGCTLEIGDTTGLDGLQVPAGSAPNGVWPKGPQVDAIRARVQSSLEQVLARDNSAGLQTRGMVVVHEGRLVAEAYAPGFTPATPLLGWSMGKSLTAIMVGHMEMLGRVDPADDNLFPAWRDDRRREINLEHLLQMSSGLAFEEVYAPGSDATHMLFTAASASAVALQSSAAHAPGAHFAYSSGTTNLLMQLMVDRLGGPQAAVDFLSMRVFAPLGMRHAVVEPDPSGVFVGSSYVYATPRDWARLGQLMLNRGELNGVRLVSEDWVRRAATPNPSDNEPRYGYQFWLNRGGERLRWPRLPADAYAMSGNRHQSVMVVPSRDAVLVRLGWTAGAYPLDENFAALLAAL